MGDVVGITDSNGNLAVENFYDAWGDNYTSAIDQCDFDGEKGGLGAYKLSNANPLTYRGYYFDHAIGMYYLQSRYMNPVVNRFFNADDPDIARESKDLAVGMNLFAYCNNDPVNRVDFSGYWASDVHSGFNSKGRECYYYYKFSGTNEYYGTYYWAIQEGYSDNFAYFIGYWCNYVDTKYNPANLDYNDWHFNGNWGTNKTDTREKHMNDMLTKAESYLKKATNKQKAGRSYYDDLRSALIYIGYALHPKQDKSAHIYDAQSPYSSKMIRKRTSKSYAKFWHIGVPNVDNANARKSAVIKTGKSTRNILRKLYGKYKILRIKNVRFSVK